jgi:hypothetical protein
MKQMDTKRYFSKEDFVCFLNLLEADKYSKVFVEYVEDGSTEEVNFLKMDFKGRFTYEVILYDHPSGSVGIIQDTPVSPWEDYAEIVYDDLIMNGEYKMFIESK